MCPEARKIILNLAPSDLHHLIFSFNMIKTREAEIEFWNFVEEIKNENRHLSGINMYFHNHQDKIGK